MRDARKGEFVPRGKCLHLCGPRLTHNKGEAMFRRVQNMPTSEKRELFQQLRRNRHFNAQTLVTSMGLTVGQCFIYAVLCDEPSRSRIGTDPNKAGDPPLH